MENKQQMEIQLIMIKKEAVDKLIKKYNNFNKVFRSVAECCIKKPTPSELYKRLFDIAEAATEISNTSSFTCYIEKYGMMQQIIMIDPTLGIRIFKLVYGAIGDCISDSLAQLGEDGKVIEMDFTYIANLFKEVLRVRNEMHRQLREYDDALFNELKQKMDEITPGCGRVIDDLMSLSKSELKEIIMDIIQKGKNQNSGKNDMEFKMKENKRSNKFYEDADLNEILDRLFSK